MGFSSPTEAEGASPEGAQPPAQVGAQPSSQGPSFGDRLGAYAQERFPIAGGLLNQLFGGGQQQGGPQQATIPTGVGPQPAQQPAPQGDLIGLNAAPQPSSGEGLKTIAKLIFGGGG